MDDWVILAPTRWKLQCFFIANCPVFNIESRNLFTGNDLRLPSGWPNQLLNELKVEKHPVKTFIGRISREFNFFGIPLLAGWPNGFPSCEKTVSRTDYPAL